MPRLTAKDYVRAHDKLRRLWLRDPTLFAELTPTEQWLLHNFFRPDEELSDRQLLQYRDQVTQERPSLPHQAGRVLNRFWETTARVGLKRVAQAKAPSGSKRVRQQDRQLLVKPLVHPKIDAHKLARAYIHLAKDRAKRQDG